MTPTENKINAFALAAGVKADTMRKVDRCCSLYYVTMASVYNVAQSAMVDAKAFLRLQPKLWRHDVKRGISEALAAYDRFNATLALTLGDRYGFWLDLSDAVDDDIRRHVAILRLSFQQWLLRYDAPHAEATAYVETALTLIRLARQMFGVLFTRFEKECHTDLRPLFRGGDFSEVEFWWDKAARPLTRTPPGAPDINFNDSPDVDLAFKIIARKLNSGHIYNNAAETALRANPDKWRYLPKEDRLRLRHGMPLSPQF